MPLFRPDDPRRKWWEDDLAVDVAPESPVSAPNVPLATPPINPREARIPEFSPGPMSRADEYSGSRNEAIMRKQPRWKTGLLGASRAAAQGGEGGLGGLAGRALGGLIGGLVNPKGVQRQVFDEQTAPEMARKWQLEDADAARQSAANKAQQAAALSQAQISRINSQNQADAAQTDIAQQNAARQQAVAASTVALNNARAEAMRAGKSIVRDIADDDGQVKTYRIGADGNMTELGGSARAAINQSNIKSREGIAARREAGVGSRFAQRQAQPKAGKRKSVGLTDVMDWAGQQNPPLSRSQAIAKWENDGYKVTR